MQEIKIWQYNRIVYAQTRIHPREWDKSNSLEFWDINNNWFLTWNPEFELINKKKRTCHLLNFILWVDHRMKIKESEKINQYLDFARELKKTVEPEGDSDTNCN